MLDYYQKCPYCEKKTCYLVIGYIGEPGGDEVRCYSCKRQWRTDWAHLTKRATDGATTDGELFHAVLEMVNPDNPHWRKTPRR